MARTWRGSVSGYCYHVLNRGNRRAKVFADELAYDSFVRLLREACTHVDMRIVGFCLMPNHFHLVLWPSGDEDLSRWMQWLLATQVRRHHQVHRTNGHVWQGRFKSFPIEQDEHLRTVLRYVERNPLRANVVARAEDWRWSSLREVMRPSLMPFLDSGPVDRGPGWLEYVNQPQTEKELDALRRSAWRGVPYGSDEWMQLTASAMGLESTLRSCWPTAKKLRGTSEKARSTGILLRNSE